jgi:excisionase family DNA binding protein
MGGEDVEDRLLYRVTEVAVFLNVSRPKVYELLASGDLRSVKIDRTRLVRGSDLRDYVESLRPLPEPSHSVRRCELDRLIRSLTDLPVIRVRTSRFF